ncbi:unnamed protein product [Cuscuta europaea]|uniref:Uncharacterized protein n=1 Tax=Cuscuta europaea TaxID=41803 RepID=A0A9P0ZG45_CUSEU|nr:unnamed protein product [Cuscuta europaea]
MKGNTIGEMQTLVGRNKGIFVPIMMNGNARDIKMMKTISDDKMNKEDEVLTAPPPPEPPPWSDRGVRDRRPTFHHWIWSSRSCSLFFNHVFLLSRTFLFR